MTKARRRVLVLSLLLVTGVRGYGQDAMLQGRVLGESGEGIPGAVVQLSNSMGEVTDAQGRFAFREVPVGEYLLRVSVMGFETLERPLKVTGRSPQSVELTMKESVTSLNEVTVSGQSEAMRLRESVASISLLDAKPYYNRSISTPDLLNTVSGVQVRQSGGLGNSAEISIQGLSGRQVKLFVDGVPMDFLLPVEELGIGASLAMFPINLMERMEVYKGAVPVGLGADALGGAINIVTRQQYQDFLEVSAEHSSFQTWRTTLNASKRFTSGFTVGLSGFYNASENNYQLDDVNIVNEFGNPEAISAPKFHDRFRSYLVKAEVGWTSQPWADRLLLSFSHGDMYDEIQHNFEMRQPYGQALNLATTYNTALTFQKSDWLDKLDVDLFLGHNRLKTGFIDTTMNIYNWRGEIIGQKTSGGEITSSQNQLEFIGDNLTGRVNLAWHASPTSKVIFNGVASFFDREGSDPVAAEYYGEDYFQNPIHINRLVGGLAFEQSFWDDRLTSQTALKAYHYQAEGFKIENGEVAFEDQNRFQPGVGQSFKWQVNRSLVTKLSYEYATRMPDRIETLGDFSAAIDANPGLKPETSHNFNLGSLYKATKWSLEVNGFYRRVRDIIILQAVPPPVLSSYENLLKTSIAGVESEVTYQPWDWLRLRANATFQDLRNRSDKEDAGVSSDRYFGERLPNQPFLFGNGEVQFTKRGLIRNNDQIQAWWSIAYVEEFFRYWEIDGRTEDKLTIPDQWLQHAGVSYTGWDQRVTITLESQNILDAQAFDNFRVQKPGRSWHLKLRFFIDNT